MLRSFKKLAFRVGRRGSFLLFLAILDFVYGYALIGIENPAYGHIDLLMPPFAWGVCWVLVGVVCFAEAFAHLDRLAFTMAVLLKFLWGSTMLLSWAFTDTNPYGWISATIFLTFSLLTAIISFWPEPRRFKEEDW